MTGLQDVLSDLLIGRSLRKRRSGLIFHAIFRNDLERSQTKALLLILARKGETVQEIDGCLSSLRRLEPPRRTPFADLLDTCGTGGDRSGSLNVSTLAALVIAAAGGHVAKHGNRAVSSKSGSSDLMESFGVNLAAPPNRMIQAIRRCGIGYFHAPGYHPVFSRVQDLRRELGTRTIFNLLGPLINPLTLRYQLVGVFRRDLVPVYAKILSAGPLRRALVCHSQDGMDEISTAVPTYTARIENRKITYGRIYPQRLGFRKAVKKDYAGGSAAQNRRLSVRILTGRQRGPHFDLIAVNAGAGLWISGRARTLKEGIAAAKETLSAKRAYQSLKTLVRMSQLR